jgi:hypothetical protein
VLRLDFLFFLGVLTHGEVVLRLDFLFFLALALGQHLRNLGIADLAAQRDQRMRRRIDAGIVFAGYVGGSPAVQGGRQIGCLMYSL